MTDSQENRLSMYLTLQEFLGNNTAVWNGIPAYVTGKTAFNTKIIAIQSIIAPQTQNITGVAQDKAAKKSTLITLALGVSSAVQSYATAAVPKNNTLFQSMKFSKSGMEGLKDTELTAKAQFIYDTANGLPATISDYGITAAVLTALQTAINNYSGAVSTPTVAKAAKGVLTKNLKTLFTETNNIFQNVLKKLTVQFETINPDFFSGFQIASRIIDLGSTTTKIRGTVSDEEKNKLAGVLIALRITGVATRVPAYQTTTNTDGYFSITKIKPGNYDIEVSLTGYTTLNETNIRFAPGKELKRKYILTTSL